MERKKINHNYVQKQGKELLKSITKELNSSKNNHLPYQKEITCYSDRHIIKLLHKNESYLITIELNFEE